LQAKNLDTVNLNAWIYLLSSSEEQVLQVCNDLGFVQTNI